MSVVCCQVEDFATGRYLVQRSPTLSRFEEYMQRNIYIYIYYMTLSMESKTGSVVCKRVWVTIVAVEEQ